MKKYLIMANTSKGRVFLGLGANGYVSLVGKDEAKRFQSVPYCVEYFHVSVRSLAKSGSIEGLCWESFKVGEEEENGGLKEVTELLVPKSVLREVMGDA